MTLVRTLTEFRNFASNAAEQWLLQALQVADRATSSPPIEAGKMCSSVRRSAEFPVPHKKQRRVV
jgi:hypothetical protein